MEGVVKGTRRSTKLPRRARLTFLALACASVRPQFRLRGSQYCSIYRYQLMISEFNFGSSSLPIGTMSPKGRRSPSLPSRRSSTELSKSSRRESRSNPMRPYHQKANQTIWRNQSCHSAPSSRNTPSSTLTRSGSSGTTRLPFPRHHLTMPPITDPS